MVHKEYVHRRKRRIISLCVTGVAAICVISLSIVAFLGRNLGDFTVSITNVGPVISLLSNTSDTDYKTFYRIDKLDTFEVYTNEYLPSDSVIDNENTTRKLGERLDSATKEVTSLYFFKLTFYIKNTGTVVANYNINLSFVENIKPSNVDYGIDDILRVRFYENLGNNDVYSPSKISASSNDSTTDDLNSDATTHDYVTFAKASHNPKEIDGSTTYQEYSDPQDTSKGLATTFEDDSSIFTREYRNLEVDQEVRYTVLFYLEGNDPECTGPKPESASLKLGLTFKTFSIATEEGS